MWLTNSHFFFAFRKVRSWVEHWLEQLLQSLNLTLAVTEWCEGLSQVVPLPQLQSSSAISLIEHVFNSAVYHVEKRELGTDCFFSCCYGWWWWWIATFVWRIDVRLALCILEPYFLFAKWAFCRRCWWCILTPKNKKKLCFFVYCCLMEKEI